MRTMKRAYLYVTRKRGKSILLFFIFLIMATFVLTGISIERASQEAQKNLREALGGRCWRSGRHFYVQKRPHIAMRSWRISARVGRCLLYCPQGAVFYKIHYKPSFAVVKNLHGIRSQIFIQLFVKGEHGFQGMDAFFHASETVVNKNVHPMGEMFALKTIELVAKYLPRAVADGNDKEAREMMAYANTFAGYYMMCTSAHTMDHVMGSFHDDLVHGAGLIEIAHAYYGFFADRKAAEEPMIKMAKAMGVCADGKLSELAAEMGERCSMKITAENYRTNSKIYRIADLLYILYNIFTETRKQ